MAGAKTARLAAVEDNAQRLFKAIGEFLGTHRLSPDPLHYAFAYDVVSNPAGALSQSVGRLTDGGFRLSANDIESLGGKIGTLAVADDGAGDAPRALADALVAKTQMQVEGFSDIVSTMRSEAAGFGRELAASADTLRATHAMGVAEVIKLTSAMLERVQAAEGRLEEATHEAEELRVKLEEARDNARRDPLTGLPNRRAFEEAFNERRAANEQLCVAVCDVDHFKRVNDHFGHAVGDRVLKAIAGALAEGCNDHLVTRYGGEEFAIVFSGVDLVDAANMLDRVRELVAAKRYRLRETDAPLGAVTFSAGLTAARDAESLATAFGRADKLLYSAKEGGRNAINTA